MSQPCDERCLNFCRLLSPVEDVHVIARGAGVRARPALMKKFGGAAWRKLKGVATVETFEGAARRAEVHWYECDGIGRRWIKRKYYLD